MTLPPWLPRLSAMFCKVSFLPSFPPCPSNSFRCLFEICLTFALFCLQISFFSLRFFSISCNILGYSAGEMLSSWIACDIASLILSNFAWTKTLIELCFSCFTAINWVGFCKAVFSRGSDMLVPDKATPIVKTQFLVNEKIGRLPL